MPTSTICDQCICKGLFYFFDTNSPKAIFFLYCKHGLGVVIGIGKCHNSSCAVDSCNSANLYARFTQGVFCKTVSGPEILFNLIFEFLPVVIVQYYQLVRPLEITIINGMYKLPSSFNG